MKTILLPEALGTEKSVAIEDAIMLKGVNCTAGSKILHNYFSPLTAVVVEKLSDAGYSIAGTVQMDEFGLDRVSADRTETQSGAVESVASEQTHFALGNDLSGKLRRQAPEAGLCYLHPTYGTVSRYGLVAAAASMDQIGVVAKTPDKAFELLSIIAGYDNRDGAMLPDKAYTYIPVDAAKVCVPANLWAGAKTEDKEALAKFSTKFETEQIDLPYFEHYSAVQYILASAEISNNISRFDGIKFGHRAENYRGLHELYTKSRTEGFDLEAKLCAILGCLVLSQDYYKPYYDKAMRLRRMIRDSISFDGYDLMVLPARLEGTPFEQSAVYAAATLAGLPALSFPFEGGVLQLISAQKCEKFLYSAWEVASR